MQARKKVNIASVEVGMTINTRAPGRDVVIVTFGQSAMGVSGQGGSMMWKNSIPAYNDFMDSAEFKALHPRVMMNYNNSDRTEFTSNELQPAEIVELLQKTFESPALDAFKGVVQESGEGLSLEIKPEH